MENSIEGLSGCVDALNRLTDDQRQPRIRAEAEAVQEIFRQVWMQRIEWVASFVLELEIRKNPDADRRKDALKLLLFAGKSMRPNKKAIERASTLEILGYGAFDALHLACAEQCQAEVLLTTDDRFIWQAKRGLGNPLLPVKNPLNWLEETS